MKIQYKKSLPIFIVIFIIILFAFLVTLYYSIKKINIAYLKNITYLQLILIIVLSIFIQFFEVFRVNIILKGFKYNVPYFKLFNVETASQIFNILPVKLASPLKLVLYKKIFNIPYSTGVAAITVEIMSSIFIAFVLSLIGIKLYFYRYKLYIPIFFIVLAGIIIFFLLLSFPLKFKNLLKNIKMPQKINRLIEFAGEFKAGIKNISKLYLFLYMFAAIVSYILSGLFLYILLSIFEYNVSLIHLTFIVVISFSIGILSMIPFGLVVLEGSLIFLLGIFKVDYNVAIFCTIFFRLMTTFLKTGIGIITSVKISRRYILKKDNI